MNEKTTDAPAEQKRRGSRGLSEELGLPPYMEAYPLKRGGYSYRVLDKNKKWVGVGRNREEAIEARNKLLGRHVSEDDQNPAEVFIKAKKGAKQRGIAFELTEDDVLSLFQRQNWRCALTQKPFNNKRPHGQRTRPWAASLDRIDSRRSYTVENCRLVCTFVNVALNTYGESLFSELLEHMVRRIVLAELKALGFNSKKLVCSNSSATKNDSKEP